MTKKVKEHVKFHYLLTDIRLCTLILSELNIFCEKYEANSKKNLSLTTNSEYKIMILLCEDFIVSLA